MKTHSFYISPEDTIQSVQEKFSQLFPHLTIHFYSQSDKISNTSCAMYSPACRMANLSPLYKGKSIQMPEDMTPEEMEILMHENFGWHVEIAYKTNHSNHKNLKYEKDTAAL